MDVSGSMGDEQKEIVRIESFWIDTWLRRAIQGPREPLHHPRRRRARGRSRDVLPHARVGRHDDLERLQALLADHRRSTTRRRSGTSIRSTSPTATTGRWTTRSPASSILKTEAPAAREHVRLRPGREPVRLRAVHQGPARALRQGRARRSRARSATRTRIVGSIKEFLGKGK